MPLSGQEEQKEEENKDDELDVYIKSKIIVSKDGVEEYETITVFNTLQIQNKHGPPKS